MKSNITKEVLKALKDCSYVGFRLNGRETVLEAVQRADFKKHGPFARDILFQHEVETNIQDYSDIPVRDAMYKGWSDQENWSASQPNQVQALRNLLKVGDCIVARWVVNNLSDMLRKKSLFCDELYIEIYRPIKNSENWKIIGAILWESNVSQHNETRIIRPF